MLLTQGVNQYCHHLSPSEIQKYGAHFCTTFFSEHSRHLNFIEALFALKQVDSQYTQNVCSEPWRGVQLHFFYTKRLHFFFSEPRKLSLAQFCSKKLVSIQF